MNDIPVNNWAVGLSVFSFGFLSVGSILFGSTVTTAVLRGLVGGILFGGLLWLVGLMIGNEKDLMDETTLEEESTSDLESIPVKAKLTESQDK